MKRIHKSNCERDSMQIVRLSAWLLVLSFVSVTLPAALAIAAAPAVAAAPTVLSQTGKTTQVRLLTTARLPAGQDNTEGMGFLFLVTPSTPAGSGLAMKETRDFQLNGASYQEKTQSEMGRRFEPKTQVMDAEQFFVDNPPLKPAEVAEVAKSAVVISITMRGARIPSDAKTTVTLQVGFERQVEEFAFSFVANPSR